MVVGEKMYGLWRKPVCSQWRKSVWFILPFTSAVSDKESGLMDVGLALK